LELLGQLARILPWRVERKLLNQGKEKTMTGRKKDPLHPLTEEERGWLERISRAQSEPTSHVIRAKEILAVADGHNYTQAAILAGRKCGDPVSHLVEQFNREGIIAIQPRHGGGPKQKYTAVERERVLREARRQPDAEKDGTQIWSLTSLQAALRKAEDGLPEISSERIWVILQEAGFRWQKSRSWCETGQVARKRKRGVVTILDPDATPKKN
jgi:transposase